MGKQRSTRTDVTKDLTSPQFCVYVQIQSASCALFNSIHFYSLHSIQFYFHSDLSKSLNPTESFQVTVPTHGQGLAPERVLTNSVGSLPVEANKWCN